jgi:hypothetical protein
MTTRLSWPPAMAVTATSGAPRSSSGRSSASRPSCNQSLTTRRVVLFAGDGANTAYGCDRFRDGAIVEGDWIGLNRDELIAHGKSLTEFLRSISGD